MAPRELDPNALPPELAQHLQTHRYACLTHGSDQGTLFILKAPRREIESLRGTVPVAVRHELYDHPSAPVIRLLLTFYDQPSRPLAFETFINAADPAQRADYADLARQRALTLLFYDESLAHRLSKRVRHTAREQIETILLVAERLCRAILPTDFDFDRARAAVQRRTSL
jgi:hypothetical protein